MRLPDDTRRALLDALGLAHQLGFLGPKPVELQLDHSLSFAAVVARVLDADRSPAPPGSIALVDLGSGGGIPGLVIAALLPAVRVTFVDSNQKRMTVLAEQVERLGLADRGDVVCTRAELFGRAVENRSSFDAVVARGFSGPAVTAECAAPLLRPGGMFVVSDAPDETRDRWPAVGLDVLGIREQERVSSPFHFFVGRQAEQCPQVYPRRVGIPDKRPLF